MAENKAKKVKEIFSDYETKANIKEAHVTALNVIKKTNTLGIILEIDEYIEVKDIWYFEKFLIERFHFSYQRYLVNQIRKEFGLEGTPVRIIVREKGEKE